jgi:hypothetical protein
VYEDEKLLNNVILPALGRLKVAYVTRREVESLHKSLQNTPYQANRAISLLSKMFSLAVSWGWRVDNPVLGIERIRKKNEIGGLIKRNWIVCGMSWINTQII